MKKILLTIFCALFYGTHLAHGAAYQMTQSLPGSKTLVRGATSQDVGGIVGYAANLWSFGIAIGGVLALAMIVYGAIEWTVSAGNESKISDAKDRITQAVIGLVLLFSAYVVLDFINPELTNLGKINEILSKVESAPAIPPETNTFNQPGTETSTACASCTVIPNDIIPASLIKPGACGANICQVSADIYSGLQNLVQEPLASQGGVRTWQIIQAYPPSVDPSAVLACHTQSGLCIDIALKPEFYETAASGDVEPDACLNLENLFKAAQQAGFGVRFLYADTPSCTVGGNDGVIETETGYDEHLHLCISARDGSTCGAESGSTGSEGGGQPSGSGTSGSTGSSGTCSIPDLTPLTGQALDMENGVKLIWTSSDSNVQKNLTALQSEYTKIEDLFLLNDGDATAKSAYRPLPYQQHFYEISTKLKEISNLGLEQECADLKSKLTLEKNKHELLDPINPPNPCAPHVKGTGLDIDWSVKIDDVTYSKNTSINGPSDPSVKKVNDFLDANNVKLHWQGLPNDRVHFNLQNPPYVCA